MNLLFIVIIAKRVIRTKKYSKRACRHMGSDESEDRFFNENRLIFDVSFRYVKFSGA